MTAELARTLLLIGLATCGAVVILLSFMPWVEFTPEPFTIAGSSDGASFSLNGTEVSRIQGAVTIQEALDQTAEACSCKRSLGDGYLVAILGGVTIAAAGLALFVRGAARSVVLVAMLASVGAFSIAGYNAIAIWEGVGRADLSDQFTNLDGDVMPALYALTALAALGAVLGGAVLATLARPAPEAPPEETDDIETDDDDDMDEDAVQLEEPNETWA